MNTITRKELKSISKDYKMTIKKALKLTLNFRGIKEYEEEKQALTSLGYDVEKDYKIMKDGCLIPVHVVKEV